MRIRAADAEDCACLADWACAMALETERRRLDRGVVSAGVARLLASPGHGRYLLACIDEAPDHGAVGALMLTREWSDWRCAEWWWIQSVYVLPAYRRRGVYRALHEHVRAEAASTPGVCGLRLYVEAGNRAARATYEARGMHETGYRVYESLRLDAAV